MAALIEGDQAPNFQLLRDGGGSISLSDFRGRPVVLYFYPKDDTAGCTQQAVDFSQHLRAFHALGAEIIGVSPNGVRSHDRFRDKHDLAIILAADEERHAITAYDVWAQKTMYGRTYMGVDRSTFLIDREGRIARIWRGVRVSGHVDEVLASVKAL
jgi:thioredoxin-dependent peroxiredoxin